MNGIDELFKWIMVLLFAVGIPWELAHLFHPGLRKRRRSKILVKLLGNKKFPEGRSFEDLRRATGMKKIEAECRELLAEIGAERIELRNGSEGWRMAKSSRPTSS